MSFLLKTIKGIKDELGKEIADLKANINAQVQIRPQIITGNSVPQTLIPPTQFNMPNVIMPMHHQILPPQ